MWNDERIDWSYEGMTYCRVSEGRNLVLQAHTMQLFMLELLAAATVMVYSN